ncbi:MAG: hypothetical protein L6Q57_08545 [Alphaproteobacteria bacterium]|nr:hypothetical protein [Alphaproteobacteria bacterium]
MATYDHFREIILKPVEHIFWELSSADPDLTQSNITLPQRNITRVQNRLKNVGINYMGEIYLRKIAIKGYGPASDNTLKSVLAIYGYEVPDVVRSSVSFNQARADEILKLEQGQERNDALVEFLRPFENVLIKPNSIRRPVEPSRAPPLNADFVAACLSDHLGVKLTPAFLKQIAADPEFIRAIRDLVEQAVKRGLGLTQTPAGPSSPGPG